MTTGLRFGALVVGLTLIAGSAYAQALRTAIVVLVVDPLGDELAPPRLAEAIATSRTGSGMQVHARAEPEAETTAARLARSGAYARQHDAAAVFWVERHEDGTLRLLIVEPREGKLWFRDLPTGASPAERIEWLALIVPRAAEALVARTAPDATPAPIVETPAAPPPRTTAPPVPRVNVGLGYAGAAPVYELGWQHGAALWARVRVHGPLFVLAGYRFTAALPLSDARVEAQAQRHPFDLGVGVRRAWDAWAAAGSLSLVVDLVTRQARGIAPEVTVSTSRTHVGIGTGASAWLERRVWGRLFVYVAAGAEVAMRPVRHVAVIGDQITPLLESRVVTPSAHLGIGGSTW